MIITLIRQKPEGKAVKGTILLPFYEDADVLVETLENADFLIPEGTYPLSITYSPKFQKRLPLISNVPNREGIRIHRGSLPEHSTGCVLTDAAGMANIQAFINRFNIYQENETEQLFLCVRTERGTQMDQSPL